MRKLGPQKSWKMKTIGNVWHASDCLISSNVRDFSVSRNFVLVFCMFVASCTSPLLFSSMVITTFPLYSFTPEKNGYLYDTLISLSLALKQCEPKWMQWRQQKPHETHRRWVALGFHTQTFQFSMYAPPLSSLPPTNWSNPQTNTQ